MSSSKWREKEWQARRWIEDQGFSVHDANIVFRENCRNIDLIVYGKYGANFAQTKSSTNAAGLDHVVIDGSPWTEQQLYEEAPIFNKHNDFMAKFIILVDTRKDGTVDFYVAPPRELEERLRVHGIAIAEKPKRDGMRRSIGFRKELPRTDLSSWLNAWHLFGEPRCAASAQSG